MATMEKCCKAYSLKKLREFSQWNGRIENIRKEQKQVDVKEVEFNRKLIDDDFIYLQETYVVERISLERNIIFDNITPEYK